MIRQITLSKKASLTWQISLIFIFTFLMVISAYVRIPLFFSPVPITMQTFVLFVSILMLDRKAFYSQIGYLLLGIGGLGVFSNAGAGLLYLFGPTGGYLIGFLLTAIFLPLVLPKEKSFLKMFLLFLAASIFYLCLGAGWLVLFHNFSIISAFSLGVLPFIVGEIVKIIAALSLPLRS